MNTSRHEIPNILIGACGSIDIIQLPQYLRSIKSKVRCNISVILTPAARQFIQLHTLSIFADRIINGTDVEKWPSEKPSKIVNDHDLMIIIPATANTIFECAHGGASNRLTTVVLSANFPVLFCPAMGEIMWKRKSVQNNIALLKNEGFEVLEPVIVENFDSSLNRKVTHPSFPEVDQIIKWIEKKLDLKGDE